MIRSVVLLVALLGCATAIPAQDKPLTEEQKARVAELKKQIADKKAETAKLEAELEKLSEAKATGLNEWSQIGDVRVKITKCKVQKVPLISDFDGKSRYVSKEPELMIWFEIQNLSDVKKIAYVRWRRSSFSDDKPISDEHGNDYSIREHDHIEGAVSYGVQTMRPGDAAHVDILCVERPVEKATRLKLELRAVQLDEKAKHRFEIPASAWTEAKK